MNFIRHKDTIINLDNAISIGLIQYEVGADIEIVYEIACDGRPTKTVTIHYDDVQQAKEEFETLYNVIRLS